MRTEIASWHMKVERETGKMRPTLVISTGRRYELLAAVDCP
jgi:hypothetical protein